MSRVGHVSDGPFCGAAISLPGLGSLELKGKEGRRTLPAVTTIDRPEIAKLREWMNDGAPNNFLSTPRLGFMNTPSIIGTWALIEAWDIGDDPSQPNKKSYPWGNPPAGYWVYDKSGHFSLMISQNPALPIPPDPFTSAPQPSWLSPAPPWKVPYELLIDTFGPVANPYAYFGTFTVEMDPKTPGSGAILHNVFSDVMRAYTGTVQARPFSFDGRNFINVGKPGTTSGSYLRRLKRLT